MSSYFIRIVNLDSYMCTPIQGLDTVYSEFRGTLINQVPILRLFGSTPLGQKICVHIHGVFPYFYIPYDGIQEINSLMYQIATSIDKAVNISLNQASSNAQHVYKISLVSGIPMYGYHNKKHQFLKVYLYNPLLIGKVSNLLMNDAVLGKLYQPYETHLNFSLQFMIDYNLHGMSNLVLSKMKFRIDPCETDHGIDPELLLPSTINKMTVCELEGDAFAEHITNREEVAFGNIAVNPGIAALWADERQRRRNKGESSQIEHLLELKRTNIHPTKSHNLYKQALLKRLAILATDTDPPDNENLNLSVYPAESPDDINIQNASLLDLHTPSSIELSLDDTTLTSPNDLDDTLSSTQPGDLSITMDADAQKLLEILEHLGENAKDLEDDSILTQVVKDDEEEEDKYLDLSIPMEAVTTPKKIIYGNDTSGSDDELPHDLNTTLIPQFDGEWDSVDEDRLDDPDIIQLNMKDNINRRRKFIKKALYVKLINMDVKRGRSMPLLDIDFPYTENDSPVPFGTKGEEKYNIINSLKPIKPIGKNNVEIPAEDNLYTKNDRFLGTKGDASKQFTNSYVFVEKYDNIINSLESIEPTDKNYVKIPAEDIQENYEPQRKRIKKSPHVKLQEEIKILGNKVKKMRRQNQLIRIIRKFHVKEHNICVLLSKKGKPKFNVISKNAMLAHYSGKKTKPLSKIDIINNILYETGNYTDPDLSLTIEYPVGKRFLYTYNNKSIYPDVIDISNTIHKYDNTKKNIVNKKIKSKSRKSKKTTRVNKCVSTKTKSFVNKNIKSKSKKLCKKTILKNKKYDTTKTKTFMNQCIKSTSEKLCKETLMNKYDVDKYESAETVNSKREILPTIHFDDLPDFLKSSISAIAHDTHDPDLENNNYVSEMYPSQISETCLVEKDDDVLDSQHGNIQEILHDNKELKKLIDDDNKANIYIFSSEYLTNIKYDDLNKIMNHSITSIENLRQNLQKHIEYLNQSTSAKTPHLSLRERNEILNKVFNKTKASRKSYIFIDHQEDNTKTFEHYSLKSLFGHYNTTLYNVKSIKDNYPKCEKKDAKNNLNLMENICLQIENKSKTITVSRNSKYKRHTACVNGNKLNAIKSDTLVSSNCNKESLPLTKVFSGRVRSNKKSRKAVNKPKNDLYDSPVCVPKVTKELRRSPRINSLAYKEINCKKTNVENSFPFIRSDTSSDSNQKIVNRNTRRKNKNTFNGCIDGKDTKDFMNLSELSIKKVLETSSRSGRKFCSSWDGTMDSSSSSEDDNKQLEYGRRLRKRAGNDSPRYSALPISVSSTNSTTSPRPPASKHLVPLNTNTNSEKKKTQVNLSQTQRPVCDINVKRRLSFSNISLQTTIIEDKVICTFSPKNRKEYIIEKSNMQISCSPQHVDEEVITKSSNNYYSDNKSNSNIEQSSDTKLISENLIDSEAKEQQKSPNSSPHTSQSGSDDEMNRSFFKSPQIADTLNLMLTTAEKYDKETNYKAREGTSKALTPCEYKVICSKKSSGESSGSSTFGLLTPYQRVVDETDRNLSIIVEDEENGFIDNAQEISDDIFSSGNSDYKNLTSPKGKGLVKGTPAKCDLNSKSAIITPCKKAPSKEEVLNSLDKYKIPHIKQEIPFYSNVEDVTGNVEIGYNVLKINSKTTLHLPEFESQTDSINKFRKLILETYSSHLQWKKNNIKNITLGYCKDRSCIITPAKKPPTVQMIRNWIKEKSREVATPVKKIEKVKIFIPLSPGNDNDDDGLDISLTVSPCTPRLSQFTASQKAIQNAPSSATTESSSEEQEGKKLKEKKLLSQSSPPLRKSLFSHDKSFINQSCQITGVSVNNTYGFDRSIDNLQEARALVEHQHLTLLVMELHIRTRGDLKPNPEYDSIRAIFYSILNDVPENHQKPSKSKGVVVINSLPLSPGATIRPILDGAGIECDVCYVDSEENLISEFLKLIKYWDPDIIAGYEIEMLSWGYLIERAFILGMNLIPLLARVKGNTSRRRDDEQQYQLRITGRIVLDVWRLMRHEIALQSYTFESIVYHILHKRVPQYPFKDLAFWWDHRSGLYRHRTAHYYLFRVVTVLELFDKLDLIGRTSELARLFGIQFYEVLSRGSQFRVESMMLRLAKPLNYIPVSPSVQQRANMKAPEYIPLILEPESKLYNDPVIVLDFQSLYPSIIIAYNYCFTTCLGRVECLGKNIPFKFGATQLKISRKRLEKLAKKDLLNFSPCGVGFVKKKVRDGILPRMLREILDTRLMVKNSMKENRDSQILQKVLHNRQLGLKLIANVTYGYTAANFSGRMPSVEVGDSVVSKGRETLQRAIEMVETTPEWGARVVYGDTDSLFVLVPGRSKEHAFEVGKKIADAVTKANPDPIKLKLEKVYQPCILQTKKRYVGYMYESPDQKEPVYDAKGIETVRRDGCPAVSKMLEKCLKLLFETKNISLIKKYVLRQFYKINSGKASIQDLTFAKEYRGAAGYRPGACVPALELARKWKAVDKRSEPRSGERVPYIIVSGPPGLPLIRLVRSPNDLINDPSLRPNALYYITRVIIPPINRCFNLIGADLNTWFNQMPRKQLQYLPSSVSPGKKSTISQYFSTTSCAACGEQTQTGICDKCNDNPQTTTVTIMEKLKSWEQKCYDCNLICQSCTSSQTEIKCVSLDCPVLYRRIQTDRDMQQSTYVRQLLCSSDFLF